MADLTLQASISAPIEVVFDVLTDHRGYVNLIALRSSTLERGGEPAPNGVGAIRVLRLVGPPIREQVTTFDRPLRFTYTLLSGAPVRTYSATVELAEQGALTALTYRIDSVPSIPVPAALWSALVRVVINQLVKGVTKEAERRAARAG